MVNIFNDDFKDFIRLLNTHKAKYLLVGGYAVILHGYRRTTGDMDIWVKNDEENYIKLRKVFFEFGLPLTGFTKEIFLNNRDTDVFTYGRAPVSIDIMTALKGCEFEEAYTISEMHIEEDVHVRFIHVNTLIAAKKAAARFKDLDDLEKLGG